MLISEYRQALLEVGSHVVKSLRNIDVIEFIRVFTLYTKRKGLKKVVQNGLFLQSEISNRLITYFCPFVSYMDHLWQKDIFILEFDMLDVYNDVTSNY